MFNTSNKIRVIVAIEGTPIGARVVPHRDDPSKVMLKAPHPEGAAALAQLCGVSPGAVVQGRNYFMVAVDRSAFLAGIAAGLGKALDAAQPTAKAEGEPEVCSFKCEECGCDDDTHWGFCSKNVN